MKKIKAQEHIIQEARNLVDGVYSPLKGFLNKKELDSVLENSRLLDGQVWPMPIVFDLSEEEKENISGENQVEVLNEEGEVEFVLKDVEIYNFDKNNFAEKLFGTSDKNHPGVTKLEEMGKWLLGGRVISKENKPEDDFYSSPAQIKKIFKDKNWKKIAAFQTRNAPHRSHEHLQRQSLREADGLFIQPIIGPKKSGDFSDQHILEAYKILIDKHFPEGSVVLGALKTFMRYAGPKEALFHALIRRNFGCSHMIIGRDHAGVGDFYGPFDAQKIFNNFTDEELGVKILKYDNAAFCQKCGRVVFDSDCPHDKKDKIFLSGTELRKKIQNNEEIPEEFMRSEIIEYLLNNKNNIFVE